MLRHFFYVAVFVVTLFSCNPKTNQTATNPETKTTVDSFEIQLDKDIEFWNERSKTELQPLLSKFNFVEDKVEGGGWYIHKNAKSKYKTHIEVPVSSNGFCYLKTNYCGEDWIFHNQTVVNIAGQTLYSSILPSYSDYIIHDNNGGNVFESCHLTFPMEDNLIILAIASNSDKKITVRLKGDQKYTDFTLTELDKELFSDCFLLSQFLVVTKNKKEYIKKVVLNEQQQGANYLTTSFHETEIKKTL